LVREIKFLKPFLIRSYYKKRYDIKSILTTENMLRKTKLFSLFTSLKKPVLSTGKNSNVCDLRLLGEPDSFV
jgi:hypothetical protein